MTFGLNEREIDRVHTSIGGSEKQVKNTRRERKNSITTPTVATDTRRLSATRGVETKQ